MPSGLNNYIALIKASESVVLLVQSWWNIMLQYCPLLAFRRRIGVAISLSMIHDSKNAVKIKICCKTDYGRFGTKRYRGWKCYLDAVALSPQGNKKSHMGKMFCLSSQVTQRANWKITTFLIISIVFRPWVWLNNLWLGVGNMNLVVRLFWKYYECLVL